MASDENAAGKEVEELPEVESYMRDHEMKEDHDEQDG